MFGGNHLLVVLLALVFTGPVRCYFAQSFPTLRIVRALRYGTHRSRAAEDRLADQRRDDRNHVQFQRGALAEIVLADAQPSGTG